ncbi:MAG TPA: ABC transporter ATP-binding protein [Thermoanaerobaculia bacterium]|nr:ABC transporter ATP-binding protein [Thermoanaerobaculia bacterium]
MAEALVIEATALRKTYDGVDALRNLDLAVPAGSIYALVGRNGAGKTTLIKILMGMARATSGNVRVFGQNPGSSDEGIEIRRRIGFVSDEKDLYASMSVEELIRFTASFFPRWRNDLALEYSRRFALPPSLKIKALSRGMRTKLALLLALCRGADLLILDEPTSGLDPVMADDVLQALVAHVAAEELTVFFSSNQIAEVEQIADRIAIIDGGRAIVSGSVDELRERYCRIQLIFEDAAPPATLRSAGVERITRSGRVMTVLSSQGSATVLDEVRDLRPLSVEVSPVNLKEIFLQSVTVED